MSVRRASVLVSALILSASVAGCSTSSFDPAGPSGNSLLVGLGLQSPPQRDIEFRQRAPLAVPPPGAQTALRNPDGTVAARPANWPTDPDRIRREREQWARNNPMAATEARNRNLTPQEEQELMRRTSVGNGVGNMPLSFSDQALADIQEIRNPTSGPIGTGSNIFTDIDPSAVPVAGSQSAAAEANELALRERYGREQTAEFGRQRVDTSGLRRTEPPRRTLTDPPAGLRRPAPE
jgi:hypothetical protein